MFDKGLLIAKEFRDKDGAANASPSAGMSLRLDEFAPTPLHCEAIPSTTLTEFLVEAENEELKGEQRSRAGIGKGG